MPATAIDPTKSVGTCPQIHQLLTICKRISLFLPVVRDEPEPARLATLERLERDLDRAIGDFDPNWVREDE